MKNDPLIIQLCPCYVDLDRDTGGVANIVRHLCLQLSRQQRAVMLLCGNRELGKIKAPPGRLKINDFLTIEIFNQNAHPLLGPVKELAARIHSDNAHSVAHVHTCFSAYTETAMRTLHQHNIPFIFTPHGKLSRHLFQHHNWAKKIWWLTTGQRAVRHASRIAVSSQDEAHHLDGLRLNVPMCAIPNGYEFPPSTTEQRHNRIISDPYILFLGYLDPRKQPHFLVEAFARSRVKQHYRLVFVGPDSYGFQETIERAAKACEVDKRVIFYGPAYGDEKWNLLRHATCLGLPSLGEGLPVVLCEAVGAGTPAVISPECNFAELVTQGAAVMVEKFDADLWGNALDHICSDESRYRSMKSAAERIRHQYTWQAVAQRWLTLYDSVFEAGVHL